MFLHSEVSKIEQFFFNCSFKTILFHSHRLDMRWFCWLSIISNPMYVNYYSFMSLERYTYILSTQTERYITLLNIKWIHALFKSWKCRTKWLNFHKRQAPKLQVNQQGPYEPCINQDLISLVSPSLPSHFTKSVRVSHCSRENIHTNKG